MDGNPSVPTDSSSRAKAKQRKQVKLDGDLDGSTEAEAISGGDAITVDERMRSGDEDDSSVPVIGVVFWCVRARNSARGCSLLFCVAAQNVAGTGGSRLGRRREERVCSVYLNLLVKVD